MSFGNGNSERITRRKFIALAGSGAGLESLACGANRLPIMPRYPGEWPSEPPRHCPFPQSNSFRRIDFTGRHKEYAAADTWYPSWAEDGALYSTFADGWVVGTHGEKISASCGAGFKSNTGYARIDGTDPLGLQVTALGVWPGSGMPYGGRYPRANLVYNGVWYCGTCCCDIDLRRSRGILYNWARLGPFLGCQYSKDQSRTWVGSPCRPWSPLFPEDIGGCGPQLRELEHSKKDSSGDAPGSDVGALIPGLPLPKLGVLHFVDFGRNMEQSPDGKAYLVGHGRAPRDRHPRLGAVSWLSGNAVYLIRLNLTPETINDGSQYEFFAGYNSAGKAKWTSRFSEMKPMLEWENHLGSVTITRIPQLGKYLMCVADGWPSTEMINTMVMESDHVAGPWRLISYLKNFGSQGYFVNIPSKFVQPDGKTFWLCYSADFTNRFLSTNYPVDPPGSGYGLCLQEVRLI